MAGQTDSITDGQPDYIDHTEAAAVLGVSLEAMRKRIARGTVDAVKVDGHWRVRIPSDQQDADRMDGTPPSGQVDGHELALSALEARINSLEAQLDTKDRQLEAKDTQIGELHRLLAQTALNAAPARPWWRFW